jgi:TolB-like protein/class 3 adenylate cyclase
MPRKIVAILLNSVRGQHPDRNPSPDRVQRRLAAILFADVVGYSRLTEQDEVGTLHRLQSVWRDVVRPNVQTRNGRIISTAGDGVLVEFASAVEAVSSAIALQQAMRLRNAALTDDKRIQLRVGINLGDIMIHGQDLHGDGVNVAARLEPLAEPGGICISATVHEHVQAKLPFPFEDGGERLVKNIAAPVHIYVIGPDTIAQLPAAVAAGMRRSACRWCAAALGIGLVGGAALWAIWLHLLPDAETSRVQNTPSGSTMLRTEPAKPEPPPLSIVALPFTNLDSDPAQDYFADGITEDLTTDLSRIPALFVISPSTALTYKRTAVDVREIGRELAVRYVLRGSVRRVAESVRINAQLIETDNARQLWAERFEAQITQFGAIQDSVTQRIATTMNATLLDAESRRIQHERPNNPDTVDLTMRGLAILNKPSSRENAQQARALFENALRLSPDYLPALNGLAQVMLVEWGSTWYSGSSEAHLEALERIVNRALATQPDDAMAIYLYGYVQKRLHKNLNQALVAFERAVAIDPNFAVAENYIGQVKTFLGRPDEAAAHTLKAIRLSPRDPQLAEWFYQMAIIGIHRQRYDEAVEWARRGVQTNPNLRYPYRVLASALALSGQIDEARTVAAELRRRYPAETITAFTKREPWTDPLYRAGQALEIDGMRLAGIPE